MTLKVLNDELKKIFGYNKFYDVEQEEATLAVWKSKNDVYINLRPGGGKSLCFQLPTILNPRKVTIVFVPTHILAQDHIEILHRHNIKAEYVHSRMLKKEHKDLLDSLGTEKMKFQFLYATTNKATGNFVKKLAIKLNSINALAYIVFDEAHCISELSHDYSPAYRNVAKLMKDVCPKIKKIALSGTSTAEVRQDVIDILDMKNPQIHMPRTDYHEGWRGVLFMDYMKDPVDYLKSFVQEMLNIAHNPDFERSVTKSNKYGIIFCRKKETLMTLVRSLNAEKISVGAYHGDLSLEERTSVYKEWLSGRISVIVTTRQFGIGLHARPVDFTIHWGMPTSMQQLYQETGRVNRKGTLTFSQLYFSVGEEIEIKTHIKSTLRKSPNEIDAASRKLRFFQEVIDYCQKIQCRHIPEWTYYGQTPKACTKCDVCRKKDSQEIRLNLYLENRKSIFNGIKEVRTIQSSSEPISDYMIKKMAQVQTTQNDLRMEKFATLHKLLLENYECCKSESENELDKDDIIKVAGELENSVYISTKFQRKYRHVIGRKIQIIRSCTDFGLICGYLKFFRVKNIKVPVVTIGDSMNRNKREKVLVHKIRVAKRKRDEKISETNENVKRSCFVRTTNKTSKPSIVCVDLASDSD